MDKERQHDLKVLRLQYLSDADRMLALGRFKESFEFLMNFKASIRPDSAACTVITQKVCELREQYHKYCAGIPELIKDLDALDQMDQYNGLMINAKVEFLRCLNKECWGVALKYELVPMD